MLRAYWLAVNATRLPHLNSNSRNNARSTITEMVERQNSVVPSSATTAATPTTVGSAATPTAAEAASAAVRRATASAETRGMACGSTAAERAVRLAC